MEPKKASEIADIARKQQTCDRKQSLNPNESTPEKVPELKSPVPETKPLGSPTKESNPILPLGEIKNGIRPESEELKSQMYKIMRGSSCSEALQNTLKYLQTLPATTKQESLIISQQSKGRWYLLPHVLEQILYSFILSERVDTSVYLDKVKCIGKDKKNQISTSLSEFYDKKLSAYRIFDELESVEREVERFKKSFHDPGNPLKSLTLLSDFRKCFTDLISPNPLNQNEASLPLIIFHLVKVLGKDYLLKDSSNCTRSILKQFFYSFLDEIKLLPKNICVEIIKMSVSKFKPEDPSNNPMMILPFLTLEQTEIMIFASKGTVRNIKSKVLPAQVGLYNSQCYTILESMLKRIQIGTDLKNSKALPVIQKNEGENVLNLQPKRVKKIPEKCFLDELLSQKNKTIYESFSCKDSHLEKCGDIASYKVPNPKNHIVSIDKFHDMIISRDMILDESLEEVIDKDTLARLDLSVVERMQKIRETHSFPISKEQKNNKTRAKLTAFKKRIAKANDKQIEEFYEAMEQRIQKLVDSNNYSGDLLPFNMKMADDYPWNGPEDIKVYLEKIFKEPSNLSLKSQKDVIQTFTEERAKPSQRFLSRAYNVSGIFQIEFLKNKETRQTLCSILLQKHKTLVYLQKSGISSKSSRGSQREFYSYILEREIKKEPLKIQGCPAVGFQRSHIHQIDALVDCPFEMAWHTQSTLGRISICENIEAMSSDQDFSKQKSLFKLLGFTCDTRLNQINGPMIKASKCCIVSQEIKLWLLSKCRTKISKIINQILPILKYRHLVEKQMRLKQKSKNEIHYKHCEVEESSVKIILAFSYIIHLLKMPFSYLEDSMRLKVFCPNHIPNPSKSSIILPCACLYGFDLLTMRKIIIDGQSRDELKKDYLQTFFNFDTKNKIWKIKEEHAEKMTKFYQSALRPSNEEHNVNSSFGVAVEITPFLDKLQQYQS